MTIPTQFILSTGIVVLLLLTIGVGGYYVTETKTIVEQGKNQSERNFQAVDKLNQTVNQFVNQFQELQQTENDRSNVSQLVMIEMERQLINLTSGQKNILDKIDINANRTFENQEKYFKPYLNKSFTDINNNLEEIKALLRNETK